MPRKDGRLERKVTDPLTGRRRSIYGFTEEELDLQSGRVTGLRHGPRDGTLRNYYLTVYLATVALRSQNWLNQIGYCMDKYVLPEFGERDMREVTREELQRAFNKWGAKLSPGTMRRFKIVLGGVFNLAVEDGLLARNPARAVRVPEGQRGRKTALTPEQLWSLYEASTGRARALVVLGGFCGLRMGEALGAARSSLKGGVLTVERQVLQFTKKQVEDMPKGHYDESRGGAVVTSKLKTPQSRRDVPIPEDLLESLLACSEGSLWLVPDAKGSWTYPNNAERDLTAAVADSGVPKVTMHELRHTWLTVMESVIECPDSVRLELAGKAKQGTDAAYLHPHMERKKDWQERFYRHLSTNRVVQSVVKQPEKQVRLKQA